MSNPTGFPKQAKGAGMDTWPMDVRCLVMSMRKFASVPNRDRRGGGRRRLETGGSILYFRDSQKEPTRACIYTRDATETEVAFVTQTMLNAGETVTMELTGPDGEPMRFKGKMLRCRQFRDGWYDSVFRIQTQPSSPAPKKRWYQCFNRVA